MPCNEAEACRNIINPGAGLLGITRAVRPLPADFQRDLEISPVLHLCFWKLVLSCCLEKAEQRNGTLDFTFQREAKTHSPIYSASKEKITLAGTYLCSENAEFLTRWFEAEAELFTLGSGFEVIYYYLLVCHL